MSETTSTTDSLPSSDAPSSSAVEAPSAPAPASAPADSSPPAPSPGTDAPPSPPSGDSRQSDRDGLLAVVQSAIDKSKPAPTDGAAETPIGDQAAAPGTPEPPRADAHPPAPDDPNAPDPTEAQLKQLRPETRKRFERLMAQRNEARLALEAVQPEINQHRQFQNTLQQAQLAPDDVNQLLFIGAALRKQDYKGFLDGVTPYVMAAQEALGLRIAPDIQRQVDDGLVSEDAARELTRTRHRLAQAEASLRDTTRQNEVQTQNSNLNEIRSRVTNWETRIRSRDPDYAHKADTVRRFSQALLQERGTPATPEQAEALVQAAYDEANRTLIALRPAPRPTRPSPSSVHVATGGAALNGQQPNTLKEAVLMALQKSQRASF